MEPQIVERDRMTLVGMGYYGPLSGEGWSAENPIGQLWQRFNRFWDAKSELIADRVVGPKAAYEVAIWNEEEYQATKSFYVFVGVEVKGLDEVPLELVSKVLPASTYALFTPAGKEITTWENTVYNEWLPESGFELASFHDCHFQIQCYEEGRFKGLGELLEESEIDVYVSLSQKE